MCGLFGFVSRTASSTIGGAALLGASRHLGRRGPDAEGFLVASGSLVRGTRASGIDPNARYRIGMAHRRLAILDLSPAGWQPFADETARRFLLFNGEIYNYTELKEELRASGFAFRSSTDTEVVLAALMHWGEDALARFQGMFGLVYVDAGRDELLLARDPFGIKPIFFVDDPSYFAFSSQMTTLMRLEGRRNRVEERALFRFLRWGFPSCDDRSLVSDIRRLEPGSSTRIELRSGRVLASESFWRVKPRRTDLSFDQAAGTLRDLLTNSVRMHLRSDVPVGVALSGGVDSSSLVALSRRVSPETNLSAFSFCATDSSVDETPIIRRTAERYGVRLHEVALAPTDFERVAQEASMLTDEVFGSTSVLAEYLVFKRAREEGVVVVLSGQGPDEMFAGYSRYRPLRAIADLYGGNLVQALRSIAASSRWPDTRLPRTLSWCAHYLMPPSLVGAARALGGRGFVTRPLDGDYFREKGAVRDIKPATRDDLPYFTRFVFQDVFSFGLQGLLAWADQTGMAHSVEGRLPYLLPSLADFAFSLPYRYLVDDAGACKAVLREAVRGIAPDEVLAVRRKIGFETDERRYLEQLRPALATMLKDGDFDAMPFVDKRAMAEDLASGRPLDRVYWRLANLRWWSEANPITLAWGEASQSAGDVLAAGLQLSVTDPVRSRSSAA